MARGPDSEEDGLLGGSQNEKPCISAKKAEEQVAWRNLPQKKQLLLLAICRLSTPLSNACLLPYIYFLVKSILSVPDHDTAPQQISRLTGLLVAAYPLGQMVTSFLWGRLSDKYGRKPAILLGLAISVTANMAFGFSRSIRMLLFWRVLAGMANGILGVMRTMTAEIVRERKYHTKAFLALPLVFNSGRVAALVIGGCLADPVHNLAWLFGPSGLFNTDKNAEGVAWTLAYPYALPALFNGAVLAVCLICATLWLRESLPSKENRWDPGLALGNTIIQALTRIFAKKHEAGYTAIRMQESESCIADDSVAKLTTNPPPVLRNLPREAGNPASDAIWRGSLLKVLVAFGLLPLHNATFLHIFPVFLSMPPSTNHNATVIRYTGGLGLASPSVGLYLATFGICGIMLQLFLYPRIQTHIGNLGVFRLASSIFPVAYLLTPYLALLSRHKTAKWVAMAAVLFLQVMARTMAMPSSVILLTEAAPRRSVMGTIHGAGSTLSAFSSTVGPVFGGFILARGIDLGIVGLVWWCWLLIVSVVTLAWSWTLARTGSNGAEGQTAQTE